MPNDFSFKGPFDPAFPAQSRNGHEDFNPPVWGLTKREYIAALILQGYAANPNLSGCVNSSVSVQDLISSAVGKAELLLKALQ